MTEVKGRGVGLSWREKNRGEKGEELMLENEGEVKAQAESRN